MATKMQREADAIWMWWHIHGVTNPQMKDRMRDMPELPEPVAKHLRRLIRHGWQEVS
jgi:hypothetical protein